MKNRSKYSTNIVIQKRYVIKTRKITMELVPVSSAHQAELKQYGGGQWYALPSTIRYKKDINRNETREIFENVINELDIPSVFPNYKVKEVEIAECRL